MADYDPTQRESFDRLQAVIDRIRPDWVRDPNIVDLRPVLKVRGRAVDTRALAIGFFVLEKAAADLLEDRGFRAIPASIEGIATDVIQVVQRPLGSVDEKATRSAMFDTLVSGCAVGNKERGAYGTLGLALLAVSDGRMVGLTNEHVLVFDNEGKPGDEVWQPRFYLQSEVSIDPADCCPDGQLHYRQVHNPIVDAAAVTFTACLIAALSDVIDPHRRGQVATVPGATERTLKETVSVELTYPEIPFPGRPYKIGTRWNYKRETDSRVLEHGVEETQVNDHVLTGQLLTTDQLQYPQGARVVLTALLGPEADRGRCSNYFVTAAVLSPSHQRAYKLILRPVDLGGDAQAGKRCFGYPGGAVGKPLRAPVQLNGIGYDPHGHTLVVVPEGGSFGLQFPPAGVEATLPFPVQEVSVRLRTGGAPVVLKAFNGAQEVATATAPASDVPVTVEVSAGSITRLEFTGGKIGVLLRICVVRRARHLCAYRGLLRLAHDEEPGEWTTYLFAQTRNDVPLGTLPTVAAQTIGGLPVTDNFVFAGESDSFIYGHRCNIELRPDGDFEVLAP